MISLTKDLMKALDSVISLVIRKSLMSSAKAARVSTLSSTARRSESNALAFSAAISSFS